MTDVLPPLYGAASRALQDHFDSRRLADRLVELTVHQALTDDDRALIADQTSVYLATVDEGGWPDVSYKGGDPGFVRVVDDTTLLVPSYDGNGMFRTLGHVAANGRIALLFVDTARPWRMRVQGRGEVLTEGPEVAAMHGAEAAIRIRVERVFPNCGRYIHQGDEISPAVPRPGHEPPVPDWKRIDLIEPYLPGSPPDAG